MTAATWRSLYLQQVAQPSNGSDPWTTWTELMANAGNIEFSRVRCYRFVEAKYFGNQPLLGNDLAGAGHQHFQHGKFPPAQFERLASERNRACSPVECQRTADQGRI